MSRPKHSGRLPPAIAALGPLIAAQIVANIMMNHWTAQGDKYSHPDPMFERLGGKR